jgi:hypothetical protein
MPLICSPNVLRQFIVFRQGVDWRIARWCSTYTAITGGYVKGTRRAVEDRRAGLSRAKTLRGSLSALNIVSDGSNFSFNDNVAREASCVSIDDNEGLVVPAEPSGAFLIGVNKPDTGRAISAGAQWGDDVAFAVIR